MEAELSHDLADSLTAPSAFGPYRVLHQIGVGVLGPVYRAHEPSRHELVAVKALKLDVPPEQAADVAQGLRALVDVWPRHAGLVDLLAAGFEGATPWLAMPFVEAATLDTRLRGDSLGSLERTLALLSGVAEALDHAHAGGVVHGSLHPRDIFVDEQQGAQVSGFGLARVLSSIGMRPPVRLPYSAPEVMDTGVPDAATDRFAFGAIAFEWLTGRRPSGLANEAAARFTLEDVKDLDRARTAMAAMLAEHPEHRPSSAVAFARTLSSALAGTRVTSVAVPIVPAADHELVTVIDTASDAAGEDAPSAEALEMFARQGMLWEATPRSRRDEWVPPADPRVTPQTLEEVDRGFAEAADLHRAELKIDAPPEPPSEPPAETADAEPDLEPSAVLRLFHDELQPVPDDESVREYEPEIEHQPALGRVSLSHEEGWSTRFTPTSPPAAKAIAAGDTERPLSREASGDALDPTPSRRGSLLFPSPGPEPRAVPVAPPEPMPQSSSPPSLVLLLTLALGLAIGGAGGYLVGQRSAAREAAERAAAGVVTIPPAGSESEPDVVVPDAPPMASSPVVPVPDPVGEAGAAGAARTTPPAPPRTPAREGRERSRPEPTRGEMIVRSMPAGAGVLVDGKWRGRTPLTLKDVPFGAHSVRVVQEGYVPETRRVTLEPKVRAATVAFQLERDAPPQAAESTSPARRDARAGSLFVVSRPVGANVLVDGRLVGATPLVVADVAPGERSIRLEYAGHRPWTSVVKVVPGERQRVAASLEETR